LIAPLRSARGRSDHAGHERRTAPSGPARPLWPVGQAGRPKLEQLSGHYLWQAAAPVGRSPGPHRAQWPGIRRKQFKLPKFVEAFRNVQKWQTKFCWTPVEQLYIVGLTKLTLVKYFIVRNCKNSNTKIFVYKYLYLVMF
jgi:hypothetical protein